MQILLKENPSDFILTSNFLDLPQIINMTQQEGLILVFTGSNVDANFIKSILEDNGIGCLVRDSLIESTLAGWASGSPEDSSRIFVKQEHEMGAKDLIEQYLNSRLDKE